MHGRLCSRVAWSTSTSRCLLPSLSTLTASTRVRVLPRLIIQVIPPNFDFSLPPEGYTLLHYAAKRPHLGLVRLLVSRGANLNSAANSEVRERPLHCAIEGGDLAVVDFLVMQGADLHAGNVKVQLFTTR